MNTHSKFHLHGGERVTVSPYVDALSFNLGNASTAGLFLSQMPAADRVRFLRELSEAADTLADEITVRELGGAA